MTTILIIDSTNLCHIAKHAMRGLSYGEKGDTGVVFGFLMSLLSLNKRFGHDVKFLFAWDSRKSLRKVVFPGYKANRKNRLSARTEEEIRFDDCARFQMLELHKLVLPAIGFSNNYLWVGYEADDVVAVLSYAKRDEPKVLVSTDKDLYQCLGTNVSIFNPITKHTITASDFKRDWNMTSNMWSSMLSIAGCDTDGVPGVEGVGLVTAAKYLRGELKGDSVIAQRIRASKELIEHNRALVTLPYGKVTDYRFEIEEDHFDQGATEALFLEYGFSSFLREPLRTAWERLLLF